MNTKLVIAAIAGLALLGGGGYVLYNKSQTNTDTQMTAPTQTEPMTSAGSLMSLFSLGNNQKCTYTDSTSESMGTIYINGPRVRGDFTANNFGSHMITDGKTMYMWMDGQSQGFKSTIASVEEAASKFTGQADSTSNESVDLQSQVDYECGEWAVVETMYQAPEDVNFVDFSQFGTTMQGESETEDSGMQCASCDALPGSAQTQCKQALGCE